jgi:hypothetical protein
VKEESILAVTVSDGGHHPLNAQTGTYQIASYVYAVRKDDRRRRMVGGLHVWKEVVIGGAAGASPQLKSEIGELQPKPKIQEQALLLYVNSARLCRTY